jgi:hypothetical protein
MTATSTRANGIALAQRAIDDLCARLDLPTPAEARPGADLWVRARAGSGWPPRAVLLPTADGWVHPGPDTAWEAFVDMTLALGAAAIRSGFPDLTALTAEAIDAEAGAWMLPAVAVRDYPAAPPRVPSPPRTPDLDDARVVLIGTAWAAPLVGLVLAQLGAEVTHVHHPRRPDPFPLASRLGVGQRHVSHDLGVDTDRACFEQLLDAADLLIVGHPPRVLANAGLDDDVLAQNMPRLQRLQIAAFEDSDRPGYGPAAECRGGWAARHDPPRLGRSSVADPVAALLGVLFAVDLLIDQPPPSAARVSLEAAVGHLLELELAGG